MQQVTTTAPNQAASVQKYFYDPLGNLQCVTSGAGSHSDCNVATGGTPTSSLLSYNTYDYLNRLIGYHAYTGGAGTTATNTATYTYDTLDRMASETETHGTNPARTTTLSYIGLTGDLAEEQQTSGGTLQTTKDYAYDIMGHRFGMTVKPSGGAATTYTYGYNLHGSVSLLIDPSGNAKAAYGYRPYGDQDSALTKGDTDPTNPLNPYRYSGHRIDSASATLDTGGRRLDPGSAHFLQAKVATSSTSDQAAAADQQSQNRYTVGDGNPMTEHEDSHLAVSADGMADAYAYPNPDPPPPPPPPSRAKPRNGIGWTIAGIGVGVFDTGKDLVGGVGHLAGSAVQVATHPQEWSGDAAAIASTVGTDTARLIHDPAGTSRRALAQGFQTLAGAADTLHTSFTAGDDFSRFRAYSHFTSSVASLAVGGPELKAVSAVGDVAKGVKITEDVSEVGRAGSVINDVAKSCRFNSFTGNTLVLMADRSKRPIKNVRVGDRVETGDAQTGQETPQRVDRLIIGQGLKHLVAIALTGETIDATHNHPFWVTDHESFEWASQLRAGEHLLLDDGRSVMIQAVAKFDDTTTVYNLSVQNVHTFFVGQQPVLVHNSCGPYLDALAKSGESKLRPDLGEMSPSKAGVSFESHAADLGEIVKGGVKEKNATGQFILEEILTDPGTYHEVPTGGNFGGTGLRFIAPGGRGAVFDALGQFQYFGKFRYSPPG